MSRKHTVKTADADRVDKWLKEIDALEADLPKLKDKLDKKRKDVAEKTKKLASEPLKKPETKEKTKEETDDEESGTARDSAA